MNAANEGWVIIILLVAFFGTGAVMERGGPESGADNDKFLVVVLIVGVLLAFIVSAIIQ